LEIVGSNGVLRINLTEKEIQRNQKQEMEV